MNTLRNRKMIISALKKIANKRVAFFMDDKKAEKQWDAQIEKATKAPVEEERWEAVRHEIKKDNLYLGEGSESIVDLWLTGKEETVKPPQKIYTIRRDEKLVAWAGVGEYKGMGNINAYVVSKYRRHGLASKVAKKAIKNSSYSTISCAGQQFPLGCKLVKEQGLDWKDIQGTSKSLP